MSRISLQEGALESNITKIEGTSSKIKSIRNCFLSTRNAIDSSILGRDNINRQFEKLLHELLELEKNVTRSSRILGDAIYAYNKAEIELQRQMDRMLQEPATTEMESCNISYEASRSKKNYAKGGFFNNIFEKLKGWFDNSLKHLRKFFEENKVEVNNDYTIKPTWYYQDEFVTSENDRIVLDKTLEVEVWDIIADIPELKETIGLAPYSLQGRITVIQEFLIDKGYDLEVTGILDAKTRYTLDIYRGIEAGPYDPNLFIGDRPLIPDYKDTTSNTTETPTEQLSEDDMASLYMLLSEIKSAYGDLTRVGAYINYPGYGVSEAVETSCKNLTDKILALQTIALFNKSVMLDEEAFNYLLNKTKEGKVLSYNDIKKLEKMLYKNEQFKETFTKWHKEENQQIFSDVITCVGLAVTLYTGIYYGSIILAEMGAAGSYQINNIMQKLSTFTGSAQIATPEGFIFGVEEAVAVVPAIAVDAVALNEAINILAINQDNIIAVLNSMNGGSGGGLPTKDSNEIAHSIRRVEDSILDEMETSGGHTLDRHVSKTNQDLIRRANQQDVEAATSFTNKNIAIKAVKENLRKNASNIADWLNNSKAGKMAFDITHDNPIGKGVLSDKKSMVYNLTNSRIILVKDSTQELGFRILTAFPVIK